MYKPRPRAPAIEKEAREERHDRIAHRVEARRRFLGQGVEAEAGKDEIKRLIVELRNQHKKNVIQEMSLKPEE